MSPTNSDCLDPETLAAYLDGLLVQTAVDRADRHIDGCATCRCELSALAATHTFPAGSQASFVVVDGAPLEGKIGRYELLRELGRGSMGVVVRAYDPELARAVAVKILSPRLWDGIDEQDARARLKREAQAMARLVHPNVVTVYDVGHHEGTIFIAMELVEGGTLRDHVLRPRGWRDALDICLRAGRGLAAAHAAKLIHRDFKPENVLCGLDGRVAVSDFGVARLDDDRPVIARSAPATVTTLAGTPAYMAPELFRGEPASVASDQFAFCVATFEALYGHRPFAGDTFAQLREQITAGAPRPPARRGVPPRIHAILLRGLATDPAERWPSLAKLLDALEHARSPRRRRLAIAAALATIVLAGGGALIAARSTPPVCEIDASALGGAWDDERRAALAHALRDRGDQVARVTGALDGYAESWLAHRRSACEATRLRGEISERVLDARVACLERGRRELSELVSLIVATPALADTSVEAVYRLRDPAACTADPDAPLTGDDVIAMARTDNDRATALLAAGKLDGAIAIATGVLARLDTRDAPGPRAEALLVLGRAQGMRGEYDASEASLGLALSEAERARADHLVATIWVELVQTTGAQKHRFEAATANMRAADAAFQRIEPGPALRARYAYVAGTLLLAQGKLEDARHQLEIAYALTESRPGERGLAASALCDAHRQLRAHELAAQHCTTAVELLTRALGPDHPKLGPAYNIRGALELDAQRPDAARRQFEQAIAIHERTGVESDRTLALALSNAAVTWMQAGDVARAKPLFERSAALFAKHHPDHPQRTMPLLGLASAALETGDVAAAIRRYEEAATVLEAVYGKHASTTLAARFNIALSYQRLPDPERADALAAELVELAEQPGREAWHIAAMARELRASIADARRDDARAIELREEALAAIAHVDRPESRAYLEMRLGGSLRRTRRLARAIPLLERAVAHYEREPGDPYTMAEAKFSLARALVDQDRRRATTLARAAARDYAAAKSGHNLVRLRAEVAAWLRAHAR